MLFSDKITLRAITHTVDSAGFETAGTPTDIDVYADKQSVYQSEHYKAAAVGRKVDLVFEVHQEDYSGQMLVVYDSKSYKVERSTAKGLGSVLLFCSKLEA
ncbi:MAG: phage head closure protein [Christensenella sp.]|nr:phage head closure protein [Christensenella sp.]